MRKTIAIALIAALLSMSASAGVLRFTAKQTAKGSVAAAKVSVKAVKKTAPVVAKGAKKLGKALF
jgi:hypothetical protein